MRIVLSWLRELCPTDLPEDRLAELLSAQGMHVEGVLHPWEGLMRVVVARVLEVRDHPDSEKLCLATVTDGGREGQVVAGVRNMGPGDLVPWAPPGARVPVLPEPLGVRTVRGRESNGMLCSPWELGISAGHGGILVLPADAPVGADFKAWAGLDDAVLDLEIEPNRPDLLSVLGVAREVSAATGVPLRPPDTTVSEGAQAAAEVATVEVRDPERCPRYLARVIRGVTVGPSPVRVQARLTAAGMRPLSNVVDATNYVMLEMGQPMHPFDLHLLAGPGIVVRPAVPGERLVTLDEVERTLSGEDLVIADLEKAVAIAGIMGSAWAEVSGSTVDVLLESANFERRGILRTARRLGLVTEASQRFERGADPEAVGPAADRAAGLIGRWSGGSVLSGAVDAGGAPPRRRLKLRAERASLVLGHAVTAEDARDVFGRLGFGAARAERAEDVEVEVPGFRPDLEREVDLIEEVARLQGYHRIGSTLPPVRQSGGVAETFSLRRRVREAMVRAGLREALSYSFASDADVALAGLAEGEAVRVANPLAADQAFLRPSLLPGLLRAIRRNQSKGNRGVALFEVGRVFRPGEAVEERELAAAALGGEAGQGYPDPQRPFDLLDAKGALERLMEGLAVEGWSLGEAPGHPLHPGRSATIIVAGDQAGILGELHPRLAAEWEVPERTAVFELDVSALAKHAGSGLGFRDIPRFPPVRRDLSFAVGQAVPAAAVGEAIRSAGGELVDSVRLMDVYVGPQIPAGRRSLTFSVDFRAPDRTLTDQEADASVRAIIDRLAAEFGAGLRSGQ